MRVAVGCYWGTKRFFSLSLDVAVSKTPNTWNGGSKDWESAARPPATSTARYLATGMGRRMERGQAEGWESEWENGGHVGGWVDEELPGGKACLGMIERLGLLNQQS